MKHFFTGFIICFFALLLTLNAALAESLPWQGVNPVILKADNFLANGDIISAEALYKAVVKDNPRQWEAWQSLARMATRQGDYPKALKAIEQGEAYSPAEPSLLAEKARIYQQWSHSPYPAKNVATYASKAIELFNIATVRYPKNPLVLAYAAEAALDIKDIPLAQQFLQALVLSRPDDIHGLKQEVRLYLLMEEPNRARQTLLRLLELAPKDAEVYWLGAQTFETMRLPDEAIRMAEQSESLDYAPLPMRDLLLANNYDQLADMDKAKLYYEKALKWNPQNADVLAKLASLQETIGETQQAQKAFGQATQIDPKLVAKLLDEALGFSQNNRPEQAPLLYRKLLALKPNVPEALEGLVNWHYRQFLAGVPDTMMLANDLSLFEKALAAGSSSKELSQLEPERLALDQLKLRLIIEGKRTVELEGQLQQVAASKNNPLLSGEAHFMLGELGKAKTDLEAFDGLTAEGYLLAEERLRSMKAYEEALVLCQRGLRIKPLNGLKNALILIDNASKTADSAIAQGNLAFDKKQWNIAIQHYQEAIQAYPESSTGYLRLSEAAEYNKNTVLAFKALNKALELQEGLKQSVPIQKRLAKLQKKLKNQVLPIEPFIPGLTLGELYAP